MTDKELMRQALEALEGVFYEPIDAERGLRCNDAAVALRERLAQPETVMAEYKLQTYAAYKTDGEMKIGVVPGVYEVTGPLHVVCQCDKCKAQPEQEQKPVAWLHPANATCVTTDPNAYARGIPLYTTPQPRLWVGLTDEDMAEPRTHIFDFIDGALWAEAKLKEKNT